MLDFPNGLHTLIPRCPRSGCGQLHRHGSWRTSWRRNCSRWSVFDTEFRQATSLFFSSRWMSIEQIVSPDPLSPSCLPSRRTDSIVQLGRWLCQYSQVLPSDVLLPSSLCRSSSSPSLNSPSESNKNRAGKIISTNSLVLRLMRELHSWLVSSVNFCHVLIDGLIDATITRLLCCSSRSNDIYHQRDVILSSRSVEIFRHFVSLPCIAAKTTFACFFRSI